MSLTPRTPDFARAVEESFSRQGLMQTLGAELVEIEPGRCVISAPIQAKASQQHGFAHAGLTFAIGDSACGYAALTLQEPGCEVLTSEMKIHLLRPAAGQQLTAEGRVLKAGRRLVVCQADVFATNGQKRSHVATLMGTIIPVST